MLEQFGKTSTANKVMIVASILVAVGAIVGIVYALSVPNERDLGLLEICWRNDVTAVYDPSECETPLALTWDRSRMPLIVGADDDSALDSAIDLVNSQVGCEVLRHENVASFDADVIVDLDAAMLVGRDHPGGATTHSRDSEFVMRAHIDVMAAGDAQTKMRVLVHELGHVLGLAHDDFRSSIMYPTQTQTSDLQFTMFTEHDQDLLNSLYCH